MTEYIAKEQVIEWFRPYGHVEEGIPYYGLVTDIREMKAADVAPVRHGLWEEADWVETDHKGFELIRTPKAAWRCSRCRHCFKKELLWRDNYCPNCGARMDGAE